MLGRFITIEGIDGAGKSTQTESLLKHLADQGVSVLHTREPGGTPLAEKIRAMLLADDMAPDAETLLFFPYTTLFRSCSAGHSADFGVRPLGAF